LRKVRSERIHEFETQLLSDLSKDVSGAEIEQVVIEAMRIGYNQGRDFKTEDILASVQKIVPLARTKNKELSLLQKWFESGNVVSASKYK
jgi:ATP-dependent 26S proteasome regulatory subunit